MFKCDDTTLSVHSQSLDEVVTTLSYDLSQVDTWCKQNRMSIHSTKCKVLFITSKGNSSRVVNAQPQIHLNDSLIETCSSAKLLGVTVNTSLSWSTRIHNVIKKCSSYLYLFSRIKVYLSVDNRKWFYNAYILPHVEYSCVTCGKLWTFPWRKCVKLQKRAARIIIDWDFFLCVPSSFKEKP